MGLFGKKETKPKTEAQLYVEKVAEDKRQKELLIGLRTDAEMKLEKSAILTLSHMSNIVRTQSIVNKNAMNKKQQIQDDMTMLITKLDNISEQNFEAVQGMRVQIKTLIAEYQHKLGEY